MSLVFIYTPAWDRRTPGYSTPPTHSGPVSCISLTDEEVEGQREDKT